MHDGAEAMPQQLVSLVTADELSKALADAAGRPLILEATMGTSAGTAFIPGTVLLDLAEIDVYDEDPTGSPVAVAGNYNLRPSVALRAALERHGITEEHHCVVYTQCRRHTVAARGGGVMKGHHHRQLLQPTSREGVADPIVAARLVWCLALAGVQRVSLLNGGMSGWLALDLPTCANPSPPSPVDDFLCGRGGAFPRCPRHSATVEEVVAAASGQAQASLGDVRSWQEYVGEGHNYAYQMPAGRVPGARLARWGPSTFVGSELYRLSCGTLRPLSEVRSIWQRAGLLTLSSADEMSEMTRDGGGSTRLIFYCGSGWRSALAWLLAVLMGHRNVASFDGGMFEWGMDPARPLEVGDPAHARLARRSGRAVSAAPPSEGDGWCFHAADGDDSCEEGPAGRELERRKRRQRALLQRHAAGAGRGGAGDSAEQAACGQGNRATAISTRP